MAKDLSSWREFIDEVNGIEDEFANHRRETETSYSKPLYRGQANAKWPLKTTLERVHKQPITMAAYQKKYVLPAHSMLPGFSERPLDNRADLSYKELRNHKIPNYEFMAKLRHHGFPSPLLDWSYSPYVAAFFAFHKVDPAEKVAIYWFQELLGEVKITSGKPKLIIAGPFADIHKRHLLQKSDYSLCFRKEGNQALFVPHKKLLGDDTQQLLQDRLMKFTLPRSLRSEVLLELDTMDINPHSICQSEDSIEDSLVRDVGHRLFIENQ